MRALHKGLLGKDKGEIPSLKEKRNRLLLYGLYAFIALSHFLLVLRSSEQYERDFEDGYDNFIYAHMTIALVLACLASSRVGNVAVETLGDVQEIVHETSNRRFSGGVSVAAQQQIAKHGNKEAYNKNYSFFGAEDLDRDGVRRSSFSVSLSSMPSLRDSASTVAVVDEESTVKNPVGTDDKNSSLVQK